jgi:N-acetylglucosamine malate deacetylase 2
MSLDLFAQATAPEGSETPPPASMLVFAHPDDEIVAVGARLGRFRSAVFVHVTDGAPRNEQDSRAHGFATPDDYRRRREEELCGALDMAGLASASRIHLRIPDQEASFHLPQLTRTLRQLFLDRRPDVVFTHPYEGGHPDHDACAFAVRRAGQSMRRNGLSAPLIVESAFYHAGPHGIETGCFLPHPESTSEICCVLACQEKERKKALLACFASQQETLRCFTAEHERFRVAPQYDFHCPPHSGQLFYEHYPWGMTSEQFCELARQADALEEEPTAACD